MTRASLRFRFAKRDGIYELRATVGNMQYRMLYFFHEQSRVVISHGFRKERQVPDREIEKALLRT